MLLIYLVSIFLFFILHRKSHFFHPPKLITLFNLLFVILPAIWIFYLFPETDYYQARVDKSQKTLLLFFIFFITFQCFWLLFGKLKFKTHEINIDSNIQIATFLLLLVSVCAKFYLFLNGQYFFEEKYAEVEKIPAIVTFLNNLYLIGLSVYIVYYYKSKEITEPSKSFFRFMMFSTIFIALLEGRRFGVIYPLILVLLAQAYFTKISYKRLFKFGMVMTFFFLVVTGMRISQATFFSKADTSDFNTLRMIGQLKEVQLQSITSSFVSRVGNHLVVTSEIIHQFEENHLQPTHNAILLSFQALIPRAFWPEKPSLSIGNKLGRELNLIHAKNDRTKINPSWVGDAYYSLGYLGVFIAAILMSSVTRISLAFFSKGSMMQAIILAQSFILLTSGFQMELAISLNNFIKFFIFLIFLIFLLKLKILKKTNMTNYFPG